MEYLVDISVLQKYSKNLYSKLSQQYPKSRRVILRGADSTALESLFNIPSSELKTPSILDKRIVKVSLEPSLWKVVPRSQLEDIEPFISSEKLNSILQNAPSARYPPETGEIEDGLSMEQVSALLEELKLKSKDLDKKKDDLKSQRDNLDREVESFDLKRSNWEKQVEDHDQKESLALARQKDDNRKLLELLELKDEEIASKNVGLSQLQEKVEEQQQKMASQTYSPQIREKENVISSQQEEINRLKAEAEKFEKSRTPKKNYFANIFGSSPKTTNNQPEVQIDSTPHPMESRNQQQPPEKMNDDWSFSLNDKTANNTSQQDGFQPGKQLADLNAMLSSKLNLIAGQLEHTQHNYAQQPRQQSIIGKLEVPILHDFSIKSIDRYCESMHQLQKILPEIDEPILIHNSLMKSNKIQLMNTLNLEEQRRVQAFIHYLMTNFASDSYIRRRAFENIKQDEEETAGSFFRRVIYEYKRAKGISEMPLYELSQNMIFRNDIYYSFTNGLKDKTLQTKVLTSDVRFEELEQKVNTWENLFKRAAELSKNDVNNINVMRCWSCGSSSHLERDCRASDKNKRQWNKKKDRRQTK